MAGSVVMVLVATFAPLEPQIAVLGSFISILAGLVLSYLEQEAEREKRRSEILEKLSVPLRLAQDPELLEQYLSYCRIMTELAGLSDPILRETALLKLASINNQILPLADGTVLFDATEGWRTVYERLLVSPNLKDYRSVAYVRSKDYWQDAPGQQSMRANFDAVVRGIGIERVVILREELWPTQSDLPEGEVRTWINEQHKHGIWVILVRENDLIHEPELRADFGIYGSRAVGTQELDDRSRTVRFTLSFDSAAIRLGNDRWQKLKLFGTPYQTLLDRASQGG
jgi:hypothetical protein